MSHWVARFTEGFTSVDGDHSVVTDRLVPGLRWATVEAAHTDFSSHLCDWCPRETGFHQADDVSARPEFSRLRVATIWRAVTFELATEQ